MAEDQTPAHFDALMAAAANANALTPKVVEDAQRELASRAAARLANSPEPSPGMQAVVKRRRV